jgi:hypothetical protein
MTQVFKPKRLKAQNFFQKILRKQPRENAVVEINNLLATKPLLDITPSEINETLYKYKENILRTFASDIAQLYEMYLRHCLNDKHLSDEDLAELKHLKRLLSLSDKTVGQLHDKVAGAIYEESVEQAIADGKLSQQERDALEKLQKELMLPSETANRLYADASKVLITRFLLNVVSDSRLSPDEEKEFEELCANLHVKPEIEPHTKEKLDRFRLYWLIENAELPEQSVSIKLYKTEKCYFTAKVNWYELRTVTKRINYAGVGARIRIAKGIYYRVGTVAPQRVTSEEMTYIDSGELYLTNKRIIFTGLKKNFTIRLERILAFTPYFDGIEIEKDAGRNPIMTIEKNADIFCLMLSRLMREV